MKTKTLLVIFALTAVAAFAQGYGKGQGPMYDPATETNISGTIESVNQMQGGMCSGTHLTLKTDKGNVEVGLGPSQFLADQKLDLKKGDTVQLIGSKTNTRRGEMFIARQITSGAKTVTLRDEKGVPAWPAGTCR